MLCNKDMTNQTVLYLCSSGLLPNAVLPPSLDHNYAQWQEREEIARAEQPVLMKKIIPAPHPKAPGEPNSPMPPTPPPPPPLLIHGEKVTLKPYKKLTCIGTTGMVYCVRS